MTHCPHGISAEYDLYVDIFRDAGYGNIFATSMSFFLADSVKGTLSFYLQVINLGINTASNPKSTKAT